MITPFTASVDTSREIRMTMAETPACRVKRENFSDGEMTVLLELYQQQSLVAEYVSSGVTQKKKAVAWQDIAPAVSAWGCSCEDGG